jgi:hypothetical protein
MSAAVSAIAFLLGIPVLAPSVLVDVVACVTRLPIVDKALLDQRRPLASRRRFLVDRNLPLMSHWLGMSFRGCPSTSGGRALSLLGRCDVE